MNSLKKHIVSAACVDSLESLIHCCQDYFVAFYNLTKIEHKATDFLLDNSKRDFDDLFSYGKMGCLWVDMHGEKATEPTVDIKIGFHSHVYDVFEQMLDMPNLTPKKSLPINMDNLSAALVVAEEVSHFVYTSHRLMHNTAISMFDLELQAEFDKILFITHRLNLETGDPHWLPILRQCYDNVRFLEQGKNSLYGDVHAIAARFWFRASESFGTRWLPGKDPKFNEKLRGIWNASGNQKIVTLNNAQSVF